VCDRKTLNNVSEMMFLGGVAIGGLVCGILSDKYGRKKTLMASVFFQTLLGESFKRPTLND
jgi:MFS family permease